MEPDILSLLRKYVSAGIGGNARTAVEMLSENYVGASGLCHLGTATCWLHHCVLISTSACTCRLCTHGGTPCLLDTAAGRQHSPRAACCLSQRIPACSGTLPTMRCSTRACSQARACRTSSWTAMLDAFCGVYCADSCSMPSSLLQEVVKQQFDPEKFAGIFQKGSSAPPKWLDGLIAHRSALAGLAPCCSPAAAGCPMLMLHSLQFSIPCGQPGAEPGVSTVCGQMKCAGPLMLHWWAGMGGS